jgi:hypothetical protein
MELSRDRKQPVRCLRKNLSPDGSTPNKDIQCLMALHYASPASTGVEHGSPPRLSLSGIVRIASPSTPEWLEGRVDLLLIRFCYNVTSWFLRLQCGINQHMERDVQNGSQHKYRLVLIQVFIR